MGVSPIGTGPTPGSRASAGVLIKVLLTLVIGGVTYLLTNLAKEPQIWTITMSVFVGGLALVIQFLADFEKRLTATTDLYAVVESSALRNDTVIQLVRNSTRLNALSSTLVDEFAFDEIRRLSEFLKNLGERRDLVCEGEDPNWLLGLAGRASTSIDATSMATTDGTGRGFVDELFWQSDLGQRYLRAQRRAVARGVVIRRVFMMDRPDLENDDNFLRMCRTHIAYGVEVRILDATSVDVSLFDFILFDRLISYEIRADTRLNPTGRPTVVTQLRLEPSLVEERVGRFAELWDAADPLASQATEAR